MATVRDIFNVLDQKAPFRTQMDFDNAGFLVGHGQAEVQRVLVALDITPQVIQEAVDRRCQLIVAHHPVIWGHIQRVTDEDTTGRKLLALAEGGIAALCAHTNLDAAEGGVSSELARLFGLQHPVPLETDGVQENGTLYGIGRAGELPGGPMPLPAFVQQAKAILRLEGIRVLDSGVPVKKLAVGGGACGSMLHAVKALGCDTFLTSDLKHDQYLEAKDLGLNLLDAGHYSTETVICPVLARWIGEVFPQVTVVVAEAQREVFAYR